jgi:hypothetical protein
MPEIPMRHLACHAASRGFLWRAASRQGNKIFNHFVPPGVQALTVKQSHR